MAKKPPLTPTQQASRVVKAQYAPVDYESRRAAARSLAEQQALNSSRTALVKLLQSGVGPAGQVYDQTVQQQQALAQGAAKLLGANPNSQIQSDLAQINAPPEQRAQLASQTQAQFPGQGAVLNINQGAIPGASLLSQKAATQQFLAGLPTVAALSGEQSLRGLLRNAQDQQATLQAERLRIGGQIPSLALNIANTQAQQRAAAQQFAADQAYKQMENQIRLAELNSTNAYHQSETNARAAAQASLDKYRTGSLNARKGSGRGGTSGYQLKTLKDGSTVVFNPNTGKWSAAKGAPAATSTAQFTPQKLVEYRGKAASLAAVLRRGAAAEGTPGSASYKKQLAPVTYDQAVREMEKAGIPLAIAVNALNRVYPSQYRVTKRGLKQTGIKQGLR